MKSPYHQPPLKGQIIKAPEFTVVAGNPALSKEAIDRAKGMDLSWDPEKFKTVKLSPFQVKWLYFKLYRWLDLESLVHWVLDRVRYHRLRVALKLKGYAMDKMEKEYDKKTAVARSQEELSARSRDSQSGEAQQ